MLQFRIAIVCSVVLLIALGWFAFRNLATWMVVSDPLPQSLDVIFTFAGDNQRLIYSKELFAKYPQARWIISYPTKKIAIPLKKDGFDTSRIQIVDSCKNTNTEAWFITGWVRHTIQTAGISRTKPLRVGLVSMPYHMKRIHLDVSRRPRDEACVYYYLPVPFEQYGLTKQDFESWWMNAQLRAAILLEFKKYVYYLWKA
jgi:uncharacterized SAM-binding protein YcdF (DUF218 family)